MPINGRATAKRRPRTDGNACRRGSRSTEYTRLKHLKECSGSMLYAIHMRFVALFCWCVAAASGQSGGTPAQAIFENHCVSCHGTTPMSGLDLRQRDTILKGGKRGPAMVLGKPEESLL